jgi:hypothetical protein
MERVTGIEPALSAWEAVPSGPVTWPDLRGGVSASDRERPLVTGVNGTLMSRRTVVRPGLMAASWSSPVLLDSCLPSGRGCRVKAREATACGLALTRRTRPRQSSSEEGGTTSLEGFGSGGVGQLECRSGGVAMYPRVTVNDSVVLSDRARSGHGVCCRARRLDLGGLVLVAAQRATHYEGVLVRCSRVPSPR